MNCFGVIIWLQHFCEFTSALSGEVRGQGYEGVPRNTGPPELVLECGPGLRHLRNK